MHFFQHSVMAARVMHFPSAYFFTVYFCVQPFSFQISHCLLIHLIPGLLHVGARTRFLSAMWEPSATSTVDSCSPRSDGKMQKLTLLESVSSRSSGPSKILSEVNQFSARDHVFSDSPCFFSRFSSQFWMHAYTVGLSLSYPDNTSATAESY